ncbi:MAG: DNA/RNA nuclease SfsA [Desulforhopalus sp.]
MLFSPPLQQGILINRYKRFLADIKLDSGEVITAYCPNTGSMLSCSTPGSLTAFSRSANPKRKYPHTLEMVMDNSTWVGVNTSRTNSLVVEAIHNGQIVEFTDAGEVKTEIKTSDHTRLDLQVKFDTESSFVEIKNCSLAVDDCAMFPDAVTARGTKHLHELIRLVRAGKRACIFFLVQRMDANRFVPATHIDQTYSDALYKAAAAGVQVLVYQAEVSPTGIGIVRSLPHPFAVRA